MPLTAQPPTRKPRLPLLEILPNMRDTRYSLPSLLAMLALCLPPTAQAVTSSNADTLNTCFWTPGQGSGPAQFSADLGTTYVAADAPIGSVIGQFERVVNAMTPGPEVQCDNNGTATLRMHTTALLPLVPNPPPVNGENVSGHVLRTSIPNVGAIVRIRDKFDGFAAADFLADTPRQRIPFNAVQTQEMAYLFALNRLNQWVTLVKLGPLEPGVHSFSGGDWFSGTFQDIGHGFNSTLTGTIVQSQCSLAANPVSADPVLLGEWDSSDFTGAGYGTAPVDFTITLSSCVSDPNQDDPWRVAMANIRLEGANGSVPVPGTDGLFTLSSDSTAAGVGIQIMRDDGVTPVALQRDVPVTAIAPSGDTVLPFTARLLQTGAVTPGIAKGSLNFTITYQ